MWHIIVAARSGLTNAAQYAARSDGTAMFHTDGHLAQESTQSKGSTPSKERLNRVERTQKIAPVFALKVFPFFL